MSDKDEYDDSAEAQILKVISIALTENKPFKGTISKSSKYVEWDNMYFKPVNIGGGLKIQLTTRYKNKDITDIEHIEQFSTRLKDMIANRQFKYLHLFTQDHELALKYNNKFRPSLLKKVSDNSNLFSSEVFDHNRQKKYIIDSNCKFLYELGLTTQDGNITKKGRDKFKQINKYIEVISPLFENKYKTGERIKIIDMGSGKGYLTFALYHYLNFILGYQCEIVGIELRSELVDKCNTIAKKLNFSALNFIMSDISDYDIENIDVLIALHACDVATDMAIAAGIKAKSAIIVLAPCCHKQVRRDTTSPDDLKAIYKHGILHERQSEILTDTIRSLILEHHGYKTKVFEFISSEHTSKNVMITAEKGNTNLKALDQVQQLKTLFGIQNHFLEALLPLMP